MVPLAVTVAVGLLEIIWALAAQPAGAIGAAAVELPAVIWAFPAQPAGAT